MKSSRTGYSTSIVTPHDMQKSRAFAEELLSSPARLPISYKMASTAQRGIPEVWHPTCNRRRVDDSIIETVFEGTDPEKGLTITVESTCYQDFPVVEWVAWFTNNGKTATPLLSDILALDAPFTGSTPKLYHCNGDFNSAEGYTPQETLMPEGNALDFAPNGGRACDGAFPYYRVNFSDFGFSMAIGWSAQWAADFTGLADGLHIRAGQEKTNLRLMPGERIRTPRMTLLFWDGDSSRAVNLWRRWYLAHVLPRPNGNPMRPLIACAASDEGEEFTAATEENQVHFIKKFNNHGIHPDVWWIDAGWYPCYNKEHIRSWPVTGTWEPDPERFPRGMKPISDCAAQHGADLLVWFEPERVASGTKLDTEHPDWLLRVKDADDWKGLNHLLNLGNSECRQKFTDHVCKIIKDNGIKIYRQDHNFSPLAYWRTNDAPDREGMNENLHVQGYLQFWDDLLARNPGLWIDSCASGGRRNDLETMRRSVPLHYTDYGYGDHPVKLAFHRTFFEWIPYFKEFTLSWDIQGQARWDDTVDSYSFHCAFAPMLFPAIDVRRDDYDYPLAARMIAIWRGIADLILYGDFYPLTPYHKDAGQWVAWQFDSPETGHGFIQGIRLPEAPDTLTIQPRAMLEDVVYVLENPETGETKRIAGRTLARDGFSFNLPPRAASVWRYCHAD